jgi:hypothetical protein
MLIGGCRHTPLLRTIRRALTIADLEHGATVDGLFKDADELLYEAKRSALLRR